MSGMKRITKNGWIAAGVAAGLLGGVVSAQADVRVVSKVDLASGSAPVSRKVTLYLKGERGRLETGDAEKVALYDYKARKIQILDTTAKTYYEKALPKPGSHPGLPGRLSSFVSVDVTGGVKPAPAEPAQSVAGILTKPYSLVTDVHVQPKQSGFGGGRRRGGAGAQGVSVHAEGKFQGAEAASVVPGASADRLLLLTQQIMNSDITSGPLASDFLKLKVIPLKGTMVVTRSGRTSTAGRTALAASAGSVTISMEVLTLEKNTTLDAALFSVPSGYQKVDPPQRGMGDSNGISSFGSFGSFGSLGGE